MSKPFAGLERMIEKATKRAVKRHLKNQVDLIASLRVKKLSGLGEPDDDKRIVKFTSSAKILYSRLRRG